MTDFIAGIYGEISPTTGPKTGSESSASGAFILSKVGENSPGDLSVCNFTQTDCS